MKLETTIFVKYAKGGRKIRNINIAIRPEPNSEVDQIRLTKFINILRSQRFLAINPSLFSSLGSIEIASVDVINKGSGE